MNGLTHLDSQGKARMVSVSGKAETKRIAVAKSRILMQSATETAIREGGVGKGEVIGVARVAGILAAKKTSELIPLCHGLNVDEIILEESWVNPGELEWTATVTTLGRTGVEMEAMVAVSIAAITVYDMCKAVDREMEVTHVGLWFKDGGKSGTFQRVNKPHHPEVL